MKIKAYSSCDRTVDNLLLILRHFVITKHIVGIYI
jgi:hypothetical protein